MWRTEYQFGPSCVHGGASSEYYPAVTGDVHYSDDRQPNGYVNPYVDTDYVSRRPTTRVDTYSNRQWHDTSAAGGYSRVRVSRCSRSFSGCRDNSSRCQWRHSQSSRRQSDVSHQSVRARYRYSVRRSVSGRRVNERSEESEYSSMASRRRQRRHRHRYSSSTSSTPSHTSSVSVSLPDTLHLFTDIQIIS